VALLFSPAVHPVPPSSIRRLAPFPGLSGKRGRTVTAALLTFVDAFPDVLSSALNAQPTPSGAIQVGGLRGGHYTLSGDGLHLDRVVYVPGVIVTGAIRFVGTNGVEARFRISGPAAAHGTITLDENLHVSGTLDGRSFQLRLPAARLASAGARSGTGAAFPRALAGALRRPDRLAALARRLHAALAGR
jgi:hypothetical protein